MRDDLQSTIVLRIPFENLYDGVTPVIDYYTKKEVKKLKDEEFATKENFEIFLGAYSEDLSKVLKENAELQRLCDEQKQQMDEAVEVITQLREQRLNMSAMEERVYSELAEGEKKLAKAEEFKKQDELKLKQLTEERNQLVEEKIQLQKEIDNLADEIEKLRADKELLLSEQTTLSTDIAQIKAERDRAMTDLNQFDEISENQISLINNIKGYEGILLEVVNEDLLEYLEILPKVNKGYLDQLLINSDYIENLWSMCDNASVDYYLLARDVNDLLTNLKISFESAGLEFSDEVILKENNISENINQTYLNGKELYEELEKND